MAKVEMIIDSLRQDLLYYEWVVILKEKLGERCLPVYIGSQQADIIKSLLVGTEPTEPVDFDFSVPDVDINIAELQSVIINRLKNNVFYAELLFTHHNKSYKVDCPPAKAIALSLRMQVPIFVEGAVLRKAAVEVQT
jgi:hypothetical protein